MKRLTFRKQAHACRGRPRRRKPNGFVALAGLTLPELIRRPAPSVVHVVAPLPICLPLSVRNFLSLGDKVVQSVRPPSWTRFSLSIFEFFMRIVRAFLGKNKRDPLQGLRRRFYRSWSVWLPKSKHLTVEPSVDISLYFERTYAELLHRFEKLKASYSFRGDLSQADS